jgi:hypothetical protein
VTDKEMAVAGKVVVEMVAERGGREEMLSFQS